LAGVGSGFEESANRSAQAVEAAFVPGELSHRLLFSGWRGWWFWWKKIYRHGGGRFLKVGGFVFNKS